MYAGASHAKKVRSERGQFLFLHLCRSLPKGLEREVIKDIVGMCLTAEDAEAQLDIVPHIIEGATEKERLHLTVGFTQASDTLMQTPFGKKYLVPPTDNLPETPRVLSRNGRILGVMIPDKDEDKSKEIAYKTYLNKDVSTPYFIRLCRKIPQTGIVNSMHLVSDYSVRKKPAMSSERVQILDGTTVNFDLELQCSEKSGKAGGGLTY